MLDTASHDPHAVGLDETTPQPCLFVIMGGGGDLAKRKLLPAAYNLALDAVLPENFVIFGFGRRELSDDEYRSFAREGNNLIGRHSFVTLDKDLPFSFKNSSLHYLLQLSYETSNP